LSSYEVVDKQNKCSIRLINNNGYSQIYNLQVKKDNKIFEEKSVHSLIISGEYLVTFPKWGGWEECYENAHEFSEAIFEEINSIKAKVENLKKMALGIIPKTVSSAIFKPSSSSQPSLQIPLINKENE
uniref:Uncharacterized protein n=1 Tax=Meloidogyne floridensis TaxID=298350 RepID=A0A915NJX8_9BILA